jgi:hypothetical protein
MTLIECSTWVVSKTSRAAIIDLTFQIWREKNLEQRCGKFLERKQVYEKVLK